MVVGVTVMVPLMSNVPAIGDANEATDINPANSTIVSTSFVRMCVNSSEIELHQSLLPLAFEIVPEPG